jgi:hypothetical protein
VGGKGGMHRGRRDAWKDGVMDGWRGKAVTDRDRQVDGRADGAREGGSDR